MKWAIVEDGIVTNIIVADEEFAAKIGAKPDYVGCAIGAPYEPPAPAPTAQERLEAQVAYTAMMTDTLLEEG